VLVGAEGDDGSKLVKKGMKKTGSFWQGDYIENAPFSWISLTANKKGKEHGKWVKKRGLCIAKGADLRAPYIVQRTGKHPTNQNKEARPKGRRKR